MPQDSFKTRRTLTVGRESFDYFSLTALEEAGFPEVSRLPFSLKILLENLLRREDNGFVRADDIRALASCGETDAESFGFADPAFAFGFGDAGGQVVADVDQALPLVGVDSQQWAAEAPLTELTPGLGRSGSLCLTRGR